MKEFITPTGVLDAINIILSAVGEAPINTLEGQLTGDMAMAKNILLETSREVQSEGWYVNTELDFPLAPNSKGHIFAPENALLVLSSRDSTWPVAVRGGKLYDPKRHSYTFQQQITADIIFLLPFEDLTEKLRRYITVRAARVFQDRALGSREAHTFQEQDEYTARVRLVQENADLQQANIAASGGGIFANYEVAAVLRR